MLVYEGIADVEIGVGDLGLRDLAHLDQGFRGHRLVADVLLDRDHLTLLVLAARDDAYLQCDSAYRLAFEGSNLSI